MKRRVTDILNNYRLAVRNKILTHVAYVFFCFLFCLPLPALAGETDITDTYIQYRNMFVPLLLLLVVSLLVIIAGLVIFIRRQKNQLRRNREYLVRYITSNLELKKQVPGLEEPYTFDPPEITPQEFIKVIDNMLKRLMFLSLFALLVLPLAAQEAVPDSAYTFRFARGKEMFFVPYRDNAPTLQRLVRRLDSCYTRLDSGYAYVSVTGYVSPQANEAETYRTGYLRNSQVKSELIVRAKLLERMFVTDKVIIGPAAEGVTDVVIVTFPAPVEKVEQIAGREAAEKILAYRKETQQSGDAPQAAEPATEPEKELKEAPSHSEADNSESPATPVEEPLTASSSGGPTSTSAPEIKNGFALRANLLRWATLTPDLGIEWRINPNWSVLLNGSWTSWSWDNKNRRYALWKLSPEVRYSLGKQKRGYAGVMFHTGEFNYKLSETGKQGDYYGGGLTGGYRLPIGKRWMVDFSLGIGYTCRIR